jgi:hypothetical protein
VQAGAYTLAGVTSWGFGCDTYVGRAGVPVVVVVVDVCIVRIV